MHTNAASNITSHNQLLATPVKISYEIDIILHPRRVFNPDCSILFVYKGEIKRYGSS
jgi:hypothetical protein